MYLDINIPSKQQKSTELEENVKADIEINNNSNSLYPFEQSNMIELQIIDTINKRNS